MEKEKRGTATSFILLGAILLGWIFFFYHIVSTSHKPLPVSPYKEDGSPKPGWGDWA